MNFTKYASIENSYRTKFISKIREQGYDTVQYSLSEKIHGANTSTLCDGEKITFAKRTSEIDKFDDFMGSNTIKSQIDAVTKEIYEIINKKEIQIFAEIAGGLYEVEDDFVNSLINPQSKKVQKGVQYHPANIWYIFDIKVDGVYISNKEMLDILEQVDFEQYPNVIYAKPIMIGTLDECLEYQNDYESTIYKEFGLPKLENNICEGSVIKPYDKVYWVGDNRVIN